MLDKYNLFFKFLEEDLNGHVNLNKKLSEEIHEIEEEKEYYMDKLQNIYNFCESKKNKTKNDWTNTICDNIMNKISSLPDDFK